MEKENKPRGCKPATTMDELDGFHPDGYRVLRIGQEAMEADSLSFVLVVTGSGQVHQWGNIETEWQKDWLTEKLDISRKLINNQKVEKDDL